MVRRILSDNFDEQVQADENGRCFIFRKDYLARGDGKTEYSLSLMYTRCPTKSFIGIKEQAPDAVRESPESQLPVQP
jgi:hypothetical protein